MKNPNNPALTPLAQQLRKNMTKEEKKLWYGCLKRLPFGFKRQRIFGKYIVDFYCPEKKTVIELDGEQHYTERGRRADAERTAYLESMGLTVLRYSNRDVNTNFEGVFDEIYYRLTGVITFPQSAQFEGNKNEF